MAGTSLVVMMSLAVCGSHVASLSVSPPIQPMVSCQVGTHIKSYLSLAVRKDRRENPGRLASQTGATWKKVAIHCVKLKEQCLELGGNGDAWTPPPTAGATNTGAQTPLHATWSFIALSAPSPATFPKASKDIIIRQREHMSRTRLPALNDPGRGYPQDSQHVYRHLATYINRGS